MIDTFKMCDIPETDAAQKRSNSRSKYKLPTNSNTKLHLLGRSYLPNGIFLVTFYTYPCCKRPYLDALPESHCSPYWPAEMYIGQYVTPKGVPANLPGHMGICWRCLAKKDEVPEVDAEAYRPVTIPRPCETT
jgi:hypothetical protein